MPRVTMLNWMSLDGCFGRDDDTTNLDWVVRDPAVDQAVHGNGDPDVAAGAAGVLLLGGTTFRGFQRSWMPFLEDATAPPPMRAVAQELTAMRKIVFSAAMTASMWANSEFPDGDPAAVVAELKRQAGADSLILGSGTIVRQLTAARLIDEYVIILTPVILGDGKRLFDDVAERSLSLAGSRPFASGNVVLRYRPG